jgi:hypothetical protein
MVQAQPLNLAFGFIQGGQSDFQAKKILMRPFPGHIQQKFPVSKADFENQGGGTAENLAPINGPGQAGRQDDVSHWNSIIMQGAEWGMLIRLIELIELIGDWLIGLVEWIKLFA